MACSPSTRRTFCPSNTDSDSVHPSTRSSDAPMQANCIQAGAKPGSTSKKKANQRGITMFGDSPRLRMLFITPTLAALAVIGLTAQSAAWSLEEAAAPYKGTTIRTIGEALPPLEAMKKLAPEFEKRTGITVEIEMYEASETASKVMLDLNSKRGRYDFILQQNRQIGKFVTNGHVEPIEPFMTSAALRDPEFKPEEQLYQGLWKEISWYGGKAYGFPFTALTMYEWYRADLMNNPKEKEGFKAKYGYELANAKDWKQYRDIAEWFTRPDQGLYGTAIQGKRHEALWYEWLNFLYSFGGDMLETKSGSECGPVIVNSGARICSRSAWLSASTRASRKPRSRFRSTKRRSASRSLGAQISGDGGKLGEGTLELR